MGLTIFCIHAFIYRRVKVGFTERMNHQPLFLKLAYSLTLHFLRADAGRLSYPRFAWILLTELLPLLILPSVLLLLKFVSFQFTNFLNTRLVLLILSAVIYSSQLKSEELQSFTLMLEGNKSSLSESSPQMWPEESFFGIIVLQWPQEPVKTCACFPHFFQK